MLTMRTTRTNRVDVSDERCVGSERHEEYNSDVTTLHHNHNYIKMCTHIVQRMMGCRNNQVSPCCQCSAFYFYGTCSHR